MNNLTVTNPTKELEVVKCIRPVLSRRNNFANQALAKLFLLIQPLRYYAASATSVNRVLLKAAIGLNNLKVTLSRLQQYPLRQFV